MTIADLTNGRWPDLLAQLGGLTPEQLTNKHQPCPLCGGKDRYRFDDQDGSGSWFCNQCGGKDQSGGGGTGMDLLMRMKHWSFKEAATALENHLGIRKPVTQKPIKPPVDAPRPELDGAVFQWCYTDAAGDPLFWIQRVNIKNGEKLFRPRTWLDGIGWQGGKGTAWPTPRPLYNLSALAARPDAGVIVCEGEKAADCAAELFPNQVAVAWPNGAQSVGKVDWSPLTGKNIMFWPDNDDEGRTAMRKAAALIGGNGKRFVVLPPEGAPEKWDIADTDWTPKQALEHVKTHRHKLEAAPVTELVEVQPGESRSRKQQTGHLDGMPFRCLGFDHGMYFYLPDKACQVVSLTPAQHIKNYLITLAPLDLWAAAYGKENEKGQVLIDWTGAADALISACIEAGVYDPSRIRGRGAWFDDSRVILHLGGRLVVDGTSSEITKLPKDFSSYYFYENAKPIQGPGNQPLGDAEAQEFADIADEFKWETPASAHLLMGWIVLAPVCGALDWRPHIWVTGPAGSGKTSLLKLFMKPLLGGMFEGATGGTTEAGLRGQLRSDAIPIVFDELEQNEQKDKQQVQNILSLARIASSEGGKIYKGTTNGGVNTFEIRSMFCVSSINVGLVQRADLDRFCVLSLRKDQISKDDWVEFEARILNACSDDNGRKLVARTISQIPLIRKNSKVIAGALAVKFGQRYGDQYGTLLAGAWTLKPNGGGEITNEQALNWIDSMNWKNREVDTNDADEVRCISKILQTILQVDGGRRIAVIELIQLSASGKTYVNEHSPTPGDEIESILGRYGLKVTQGCLAVANSSTNLQGILRDTPWAGTAYRQALRRLPEATIAASPVRFKGMGPSRATLVPLDTLEIL
jgi:putative DNA primase/helicase